MSRETVPGGIVQDILPNWIPANPIGISLPFGRGNNFGYPKIDFAESFSSLLPAHPLNEADPIKAGVYAWVIYGVLIVAHWSYYSNRYYYEYTMSEFGWMHAAWRSWYGLATFVRDFGKCFGWGIAGVFWAFSMIPIGTTFIYFTHAVTYLLMLETALIFFGILVKVAAFFNDSYLNEQHVSIWSKDVN